MLALWGTLAVVFFPVMFLIFFFKNFKAILTFVIGGFLLLFAFEYAVIGLAYVIKHPIDVVVCAVVIVAVFCTMMKKASQQPGYAYAAPTPTYAHVPTQAPPQPAYVPTEDYVSQPVFHPQPDYTKINAARDYVNRHRFMAVNPEWFPCFADYEQTGVLKRVWPFSYDSLLLVEDWYSNNPHLAHLPPRHEGLYYDTNLHQFCYNG